jgi:hypothetical protein
MVFSGHDLDEEEDLAANVLLFSGLLGKSDRYKYRVLACQALSPSELNNYKQSEWRLMRKESLFR